MVFGQTLQIRAIPAIGPTVPDPTDLIMQVFQLQGHHRSAHVPAALALSGCVTDSRMRLLDGIR